MAAGSFDFDLIVIGGGSGGSAVAKRAAGYGAKVCLIERGVSREDGVRKGAGVGGTCVNVGCVPKKIMFMAAQWREGMVGHISTAKGFGYDIPAEAGKVDWAGLKQRRDAYVAGLNKTYLNGWTGAGITSYMGIASFVDKTHIKLDSSDGSGSKTLSAPKIVLACGGEPALADIPGKELAITSDGFFDLEQQPSKVAVIGAGYIAVEMAGILQGLGSEAHLFFRQDGVLKRGFDHFITDILMEEMKAHGPSMHELSTPVKIEKAPDGKLSYTEKAPSGKETTHEGFDCVLMAIGRRPVTDLLNLGAAGVTVNDKGLINVDEYENTSTDGVYAIGDCTVTGYELTPVAIAAGRRLADRLFGGEPRARIDYRLIATVVFSHPPIGTIGLTEEQAKQDPTLGGPENIVVKEAKFSSMSYAFNEAEGKVKTGLKLVLKLPEERIVGLHCIGPGSDEMLQGFAVAIRMGATRADFEASVAIHPTISEEFVTMGGWGQTKAADGKMVPQLPPYISGSCCPPGSWPAVQVAEGYNYDKKGKMSKIGDDLPVYTVGTGEKGVIILPDIFGWSQMKGRFFGIADTLAEQGFNVVLLDPFRGDTAEGKPDMIAWIKGFTWSAVEKDIQKCATLLGESGCKKGFGLIGFCWGQWALVKAAGEDMGLKCGVGLHPSSHLEEVAHGGSEVAIYEKVNIPILQMPAGGDKPQVKEGGACANLIAAKGGKTIEFPDMQHGWSCRGDLSDKTVARDVELAMRNMVDFLKEHL